MSTITDLLGAALAAALKNPSTLLLGALVVAFVVAVQWARQARSRGSVQIYFAHNWDISSDEAKPEKPDPDTSRQPRRVGRRGR